MKTRKLQASLLTGAVSTLFGLSVAAQNSITTPDGTVPAPLSFGVSQVVQLSQAQVADTTIVNYVQNSGINYTLTTDDIVYLKQQSVSDTVINAMLNEHSSASAPATTTAANDTTAQAVQRSDIFLQPVVAYVEPVYIQPAPVSSSVIIIPDTQTARYHSWYYNHANGFRYGNGFDSPYTTYSYRAVSVSTGYGPHFAGHSHIHVVRRH